MDHNSRMAYVSSFSEIVKMSHLCSRIISSTFVQFIQYCLGWIMNVAVYQYMCAKPNTWYILSFNCQRVQCCLTSLNMVQRLENILSTYTLKLGHSKSVTEKQQDNRNICIFHVILSLKNLYPSSSACANYMRNTCFFFRNPSVVRTFC